MSNINKNSEPQEGDNRFNGDIEPFRSQLRSILLITGIFFLGFISRIILAPLMPTIESDLGISHGRAGSLFFLISLGASISTLGAGYVSSRIMHRGTIVFSAVVGGVVLIGISFTRGLWEISAGLFLMGMVGGLYIPSAISTLTSIVSVKHWGKAFAIHELAPNVSFVVAPLLSMALLPLLAWQGILALLGGTGILLGFMYAAFGRGGRFPGEAPSFVSFRRLLANPTFWVMTFLMSLGVISTNGVYTMLPLYLVKERGMDPNWVNTLIGLSYVSCIGIAFLAGWATDRFGPKAVMGVVLLITGILTVLLGAAPTSWLSIIVFLQPMTACSFFPAGFAALSRIGSADTRNVTVSLSTPMAGTFGAGIIPTGLGVMGDAGFFGLGIALAGGLIFTGFLIALYLKLPE